MSVQQSILRGIKDQLFYHDYLVLPGFGGFVLRSSPARLLASGGTLAPAAKLVSFNAQLKQNDGVLSAWLQQQLGCSRPEAETHLREFSDYCHGVLQARRRLTLTDIGFFYLDFENNICFEPRADANFLRDSFGLMPVAATPLPEPASEAAPKKETVFTSRVLSAADTVPAPTDRPAEGPAAPKRRYRRFAVPVLSALLLLSLVSLLVLNTRISGQLQAAMFNSDASRRFEPLPYPDLQLSDAAVNANTAYVADASGHASLTLDNGKTLVVKVVDVPATPDQVPPQKSMKYSRSKAYEIVLGCFSVLNNARRMQSRLTREQIPAGISPQLHKGMHVVTAGSYASLAEAQEALSKLKAGYPNAWIKKPGL